MTAKEETYVAARSNEFGYANYELTPAPVFLGTEVKDAGSRPDRWRTREMAARAVAAALATSWRRPAAGECLRDLPVGQSR